MQHLAAVQLAEHLKDARDFPARCSFAPALAGSMKKRAEIAVPRILQCEAIQKLAVRPGRRERVEHANRARMVVEHLTEVRFAQPGFFVGTHLEAELCRHSR